MLVEGLIDPGLIRSQGAAALEQKDNASKSARDRLWARVGGGRWRRWVYHVGSGGYLLTPPWVVNRSSMSLACSSSTARIVSIITRVAGSSSPKKRISSR